jgi:hypothetical protein
VRKIIPKVITKHQTLCFRCERRAEFLESGHGPRCECKDRDKAVSSCYMYRPVRPVVLAANSGEKRPVVAGSMLSGRSHAVGFFGALRCISAGQCTALYWGPEGD